MAGELPEKAQALSEKQLKFCREYVVDLNATQAAIRAGYSEKGAAVQAVRLLINAKVTNEVQRLVKEAESKAVMSAAEVLSELTALAQANLEEIFDENDCVKSMKEIPKALWPAIQSIESEELFGGTGKNRTVIGIRKKIRLWNKNAALETLAKYHRLLTEGASTTNVQINQTTNIQNNHAKVVIWLPPKNKSLPT